MPTQRPLIPKDYKLAPKIPCTGDSAACYEPLFTYHSVSMGQYLAMTDDIEQGEHNLPYCVVMSHTIDHEDADCANLMVQITINDILNIVLVPKYPLDEYKSCLPLALFKGLKFKLTEEIENFNADLCEFNFKKGECTYLRPANKPQQVVVFTITYNGEVKGYYDVSTPPPVTD